MRSGIRIVDQSSASNIVLYGDTNINETVTNTTTNTVLAYNIPLNPSADIFGLNDILTFKIRRTVLASASAKRIRVYLGPTPGTLVGATQIISLFNTTAGSTRSPGVRSFYFNGGLTTLNGAELGDATLAGSTSDEINNNNSWADYTVPSFAPGSPLVYVIVTFQNGLVSDSQTLNFLQLIHYKL